ncbi:radical SAM family heme chaperone HemW [Actinomadura fibrosa]
MVNAILKELELRKGEIEEQVETIYFGGGTPSLLTAEELASIFKKIYVEYSVAKDAEITLEANPDDLSEEKLKTLGASPINRLSIGVQSFFEDDLKLMNRAHNEKEALRSIKTAKEFFDNISIDLIYGIPGMSNERWKENLQTAIDLGVPHISSYALTVEPRTALKSMIQKGKIAPVEEEQARQQYEIMIEMLEAAGFDNYEFSNFGKTGYFSRNNTAYWFGKPYLGIGPSAHSYDGKSRKWNINNNSLYIKAIEQGNLPMETEELSLTDRYNEYVMTRLRTKWGISVAEVESEFGKEVKDYLLNEAENLIAKGLLVQQEGRIKVSKKGKFLSDGIAADLFLVDLEQN